MAAGAGDASQRQHSISRPKENTVSHGWYLIAMVSVIVVVTALVTPAVFLEKCAQCGKRNFVDAPHCKGCGNALPQREED